MRFTFLVIGSIKEKWMQQGINEYVKRLSLIGKINILEQSEIKMPDNPSDAEKRKVLEEEGEKILKHVNDRDMVILLDLQGKSFSSEELASYLEEKMVTGVSHFFFVIGGPYGNGGNIRKRANLKISLSEMTFTHQMARLILSEQLYRAMKIIKHEPYHL